MICVPFLMFLNQILNPHCWHTAVLKSTLTWPCHKSDPNPAKASNYLGNAPISKSLYINRPDLKTHYILRYSQIQTQNCPPNKICNTFLLKFTKIYNRRSKSFPTHKEFQRNHSGINCKGYF